MKHFLLLLSMVILPLLGAAQRQMRVFQDYNQCYSGFLSHRGDTLFSAQFESIQYWNGFLDSDSLDHIWIVRKDDVTGIMDPKGDYILRPHYDSIIVYDRKRDFNHMKRAYFVAYKDGRYGIIDHRGREVLPFEFLWIENSRMQQLLVQVENGNRGIYNLDSNRYIVQPNYDNVEGKYKRMFMGQGDDRFFVYYMVWKDDLAGLVTKEGKELFSPQYSYYSFIIPNEWYLNKRPWFNVTNNRKRGVVHPDGQEVLAPIYDELNVHFEMDDLCGEITSVTAVSHEENGYQQHNLLTGESSKYYSELHQIGNQAFFITKREWGIVDVHGKEIFRTKRKFTPLITSIEGDSKILYERNLREMPKNERKYFNYETYEPYGVFDFKRNKKLPRKYIYHKSHEMDDSTFYWLYSPIEGSNKRNLEIYNEDLDLVIQHEVRSTGLEDLWEDFFWGDGKHLESIVVFEKDRNHFGAMNFRGDIIIEPEFKEFAPIPVQIPLPADFRLYKVDYYKAFTDSTVTIFSDKGKQLSSDRYRNIEPIFESMYLGERKGAYDFLNADFEVLYQDFDTVFNARYSGYSWKETAISLVDSLNTNTKYVRGPQFALKKNRVFLMSGGQLIPLDSTTLNYSFDLLHIGDFLIDKQGEIVINAIDPYVMLRNHGGYYILKRSDTSFFFDKNGELLLSVEYLNSHSYRNRNLEVILKFRNGKEGIFNLQTKEWIKMPEFLKDPILNFGNYSNVHWLRESDPIDNRHRYILADSADNIITPVWFDAVPKFSSYTDKIKFMYRGKWGMIDRDLNVIIEPEYDFLDRYGHVVLMKKGSLWGFQSKEGKVIDAQFNNMGLKSYPKGRVVFKNGMVGVIRHSGEWCIPLCSPKDFMSLYNVADSLYGKSKNKEKPYIYEGLVFEEDSLAVFTAFNNEIIYNENSVISTNYSFFPRKKGRTKLLSADPVNYIQKTWSAKVQFLSEHYYAIYQDETSMTWKERRYYPDEIEKWIVYKVGDEYRSPVQFEELFSGAGAMDVVDKAIMEAFNKRQVFGISCVDKTKVLNDAKKNFTLTTEGILFKDVVRGKDVLLLYEKVKPVLAHPDDFF